MSGEFHYDRDCFCQLRCAGHAVAISSANAYECIGPKPVPVEINDQTPSGFSESNVWPTMQMNSGRAPCVVMRVHVF